ncbi:MAG: polyprenyl diphosphate synthase [Leptospiraceae bacterium]|nr:polyprenyl diphosphate synthase [Leptospiraceae bacterium]MDW7976691.1 polyprenyl diphosphate synthase [Leptospiraceae bacterium]
MSEAEKKLPKHVAIILDGNGRWAQRRNLPRTEGHRKGGENLRKLIDVVLELQIPYISLYTFSTENWKRPKSEVQFLWQLMKEFFQKYIDECIEKQISIKVSGDTQKLPIENQQVLNEAVAKTKIFGKLIVNFCINYGSQQEILHACNVLLEQKIEQYKKTGYYTKADIEEFEKCLYTYPLPPVDLLIRPGGEKRISNFLLWQNAYAEIYFTDTLWPDFTKEDLIKALDWYSTRQRKFGGLIPV